MKLALLLFGMSKMEYIKINSNKIDFIIYKIDFIDYKKFIIDIYLTYTYGR